MSSEDAERWDARYADRDGRPTRARMPIALEHADDSHLADFPTAGTALDIASGLGEQTLWLAERGLRVDALDISPVAMTSLLAAVGDAGFSDGVTGRVDDLDDGIPADLGPFDVVVCQRFRAPHLYEPMLERLRSGGWLVMTVLSETGASDPGEFHAPPGELTLFFDRPGCTLVSHHEADGEESIVVRTNARA